MAYNNYNLRLVIRIILLLGNVFLTGSTILMMGKRDIFFMPLILTLVLIVQVIDLIRFINKTNTELAKFIENLRSADFSVKMKTGKLGKPFTVLQEAFDKVGISVKQLQMEKEAQFHYLQLVISHINIGIISIKGDREIVMINDPAKAMLGNIQCRSWDDILRAQPEFAMHIDKIRGKGNRLIEVRINNERRHLSVNISTLILMEENFRIITFQDVRGVIEQKEIEAWHKLIQILRHEIMNSLTPIASMTETIAMLVEDQMGHAKKLNDFHDKDIDDIRESTRTIRERSDGLYKFVENYRDLTKIPALKMRNVRMQRLFESIRRLMQADLKRKGIHLMTELVRKDLTIKADQSLIEQVLINLISNSIHALESTNHPEIRVVGEENRNIGIIKVIDNGIGIEEKNLEEIFIPFYSTRKDGSGIGLSISRQIMHLHGGYITADSDPGGKTELCLIFPG